MKDWWKVPLGILCGLLGAGVILLVSKQPQGESIILHPPPSPLPIIVHVDGAVQNPGVYPLPAHSRLKDAIEAAGGLSANADTQKINLAAILEDGEKVWVPFKPTATHTPGQTNTRGLSSTQPANALININTATQAELETLPGIGPVTAQKIIAYREEHGPFAQIEDIQDVPGIGPKTFEKIKDLITV